MGELSSAARLTPRDEKRSGPGLEAELTHLLGPGRDARILARFSGFAGKQDNRLRTIAAEFGVSHERVRQIVAAQSGVSRKGDISAPLLGRVIQFVSDRLPASATQLENELRSAGFTSAAFRMEALVRAAELFGRTLPFSITKVRGIKMVHSGTASPEKVIQLAREIIESRGASTILETVILARQLSVDFSDRQFTNILAAQSAFHWIDRTAGWFWISDVQRNPLVNRIRKAVSVSNPIGVPELRAAVARGSRMPESVPPVEILCTFCGQLSGLQARNHKIYASPPVDSRQVLSKSERDVLQMLNERGGVMSRYDLMSLWVGKGASPATLDLVLRRSPIITHSSIGIYGLTGFSDPAATPK